MKKILSIVAGVAMVMGVAGQAMAATTGNISLAAYENSGGGLPIDGTGLTATIDLGAVGTVATEGYSYDTELTASDLGADSWSDVYLAIFGGGLDDEYWEDDVYFTSDADLDEISVTKSSFSSYTVSIDNIAMELDDGETLIQTTADSEYYQTLNKDGDAAGTYNTLVRNGADLQLADNSLTTVALYHVALDGNSVDPDTLEVAGYYTLDTTGSTLVVSFSETSEVPVPGAFILLGSALIGMVGVRRKIA